MSVLKIYGKCTLLLDFNNLILQWGYIQNTIATYPLSFNHVYAGNISWISSSNAYRSMWHFTNTTIGISGAAMGFYYFAIGI